MTPTPQEISQIKLKWHSAKDLALRMTSQHSLKDSTFHYHHTKKNVDVYACKQQGESALVVRGDSICENVSADEFAKSYLSTNLEIWQKLDPNMKRIELLDEWTDKEGHWQVLYYLVSSGAPLVSDRDFLYVMKYQQQEDFSFFLSTSVDGLYEPRSTFIPTKGAVRGTNIYVCQRYDPLEGGKDIHVTDSSQCLVNGWIPQSVVNTVIYPIPLNIALNAEMLNKTLRLPPNSPSLREKK
ncbi:hypothetical protein C9374_011460 [Naegleria lovaniensis]|uniref:START domain-containing protein n=1 Tax=Naegleria lovaniensis TaxID=51637 RepID=A0AA88GXE1_NAELO|nr:uncharacterized protein C9374_011460 [Naegleria lovaniensis]KAG2392735.1 hypothetical protein C9374_011460 [Naegleria lovaniensis]